MQRLHFALHDDWKQLVGLSALLKLINQSRLLGCSEGDGWCDRQGCKGQDGGR